MSEPRSILLLGGSGTEAARLRRTLSRHFLLVETARDMPEASVMAQRCQFHTLVLVDPRLSWPQLQAMRAGYDSLPATTLLIVPKSRAEYAIAALRGGATDVLVRPFSSDELVAALMAPGGSGVPGEEKPGPGKAREAGMQGYPEDWTLEEVKNHHMARVLEASGGNKSAAARRLGVSRKTLERNLGTGAGKPGRQS